MMSYRTAHTCQCRRPVALETCLVHGLRVTVECQVSNCRLNAMRSPAHLKSVTRAHGSLRQRSLSGSALRDEHQQRHHMTQLYNG